MVTMFPIFSVLPVARRGKLWFLIRFGGGSVSGLHRNIQSSSSFIIKGILIKTVLASWAEWASVPASPVLGIYLLQTTLPVIAALNQSRGRLQVWIGQVAGASAGSSVLPRCWYENPLSPPAGGEESEGCCIPRNPSRYRAGISVVIQEEWQAVCLEHFKLLVFFF